MRAVRLLGTGASTAALFLLAAMFMGDRLPAAESDALTSAEFVVLVDFIPDNPINIGVSMSAGGASCESGSVTPTYLLVSEANPATFTVSDFTGDPLCNPMVTLIPLGYSSTGMCHERLSRGNCTIVFLLNTAQLVVYKDFSDDSPADVTVSLSCPAGSIANDDTTASELDPANFTVTGGTYGDAGCTAAETPVPAGYLSTGTCGGFWVGTGDNNWACTINNERDSDGDNVADTADNCPNINNAGQEDGDSDTLGDACDNCPATANQSQADSDSDTLGNSCDNCPTTTNAGQENADGDPRGDACELPGCETLATAWTNPAGDATDCDGFPDTVTAGPRGREDFIGTDAADRCADTTTFNDETAPGESPWPPDVNDNRQANLSDIVAFGPWFNQAGPNPPNTSYNPRFDLNASGAVNLSDIVGLGPFFNKSCTP